MTNAPVWRCSQKRWVTWMIRVVLLDLDDTLLLSPGNAFLGGFLSKLMAFLENDLAAPHAGQILRAATERMTTSLDPLTANLEIWEQVVNDKIPSLVDGAYRAAIQRFYAISYPELEAQTHPDPLAAALVEALIERDYEVIIATNPLYPAVGIEQRVRWAGLDRFQFARVTHAENSHFAKPQPAYYQEILAATGYEPGEAIMIGDSYGNDIIPAVAAGLRAYWVESDGLAADGSIRPDGQGDLRRLKDMIVNEGWLENLPPRELEPAHMLSRLLADVAALAGMARSIPERFWNQRPDPQEWTPLEIVVHLKNTNAKPFAPA